MRRYFLLSLRRLPSLHHDVGFTCCRHRRHRHGCRRLRHRQRRLRHRLPPTPTPAVHPRKPTPADRWNTSLTPLVASPSQLPQLRPLKHHYRHRHRSAAVHQGELQPLPDPFERVCARALLSRNRSIPATAGSDPHECTISSSVISTAAVAMPAVPVAFAARSSATRCALLHVLCCVPQCAPHRRPSHSPSDCVIALVAIASRPRLAGGIFESGLFQQFQHPRLVIKRSLTNLDVHGPCAAFSP